MLRTAVVVIVTIGTAWGQSAISAKSGLIHHVEGAATVTGDGSNLTAGKFYNITEGGLLRTEKGRAEILLNPGVFLRVDNNTVVKMISSKLTDTHIEIERGLALLEVDDLAKDNRLTVHIGDATVVPLKTGLYEFDAEARELKLYDGRATVNLNASSLKVGRGRIVSLTPVLKASKFDRKKVDDIFAWSSNRSNVLARANRDLAWSTAQFNGNRSTASMWGWYPDLGMFTYLPGRGRVYNPFGWYFFSPVAMWQIYYAPVRTYSPDVSASNGSYGSYESRSASSTPQAPAAVAASTGDIGRAAPSAPAQATGPRSR